MKKQLIAAALCGLFFCNSSVLAGDYTEDILRTLNSYRTGTMAFAKPKVDKIDIDDKKKTITVEFNDAAAYIPLDTRQVESLKADIKATLPAEYAKYKLVLKVGRHTFEQLAIGAPKKIAKPTDKKPFITKIGAPEAPKGLEGNNIALWQSHGRYFAQNINSWAWQRPRLYQTCEDLLTQSFVMPFLMPMLENAGAYVMSPRERDVNIAEYIIDNDIEHSGYSETEGAKPWSDAPRAGFSHRGGDLLTGQNPFSAGTARQVQGVKGDSDLSTASWNTTIDKPGLYAVYVSYQTVPNSATDAMYTINAADGQHKVKINQKMGGGTWVYLGHYPLNAGKADLPIVTLSNATVDKKAVVTADAVKIGGGMGNVARSQDSPQPLVKSEPVTSGYPRFTEGSRYWLQWAGAPDSVYTPTNNGNDYNDDYRSRALWVNWLTGGSSVLPKREGLNIPIDLSLAFHTDAGVTDNDSIIGTLGIYCTDNKDAYPNGTARLAARDYTDAVMTNIVDDVRATFEPNWTRRGMWDSGYAEARAPEVPAMLLELLSHQNFADMRLALDPSFRFVVSRAIYKGMLEYLSARDGVDYGVQPLPVTTMSITGGEGGKYRLTWAAQPDKLEPTAAPTYYIVQERRPGTIGFAEIARVTEPAYDITVTDNLIHSYRVIAGNDGGVSFPSEVLALCYKPDAPQVLIVNGFTRVSAPAWFDFGEAAGFIDEEDPGVPYLQDIAYVGTMFESRRDIPWRMNEKAGQGASRSDYEDKVLAGNTFDFTVIHGNSIAKAGYGFISQSVDAFIAQEPTAPIVDLILGNQRETAPGSGKHGTRYKTFSAPLQQRLSAYTQAGGNVFVSGAYIASDLWNNPHSTDAIAKADQEFASNVLGFTWLCGNATKIGRVVGVASPFKMFDDVNFNFYNTLNSDCYAAVAPDAVSAASDKSAVILKYDHTDFSAGTAYAADTHKAVVIGVPFETIEKDSARDALMSDILNFFK